MSAPESVTVTTVVEAEPALAFAVFTEEVDSWWKQGPRFRPGGLRPSSMRFEPGVDGRLLEVYEDEAGGSFELGRVVVWEPAKRLVFRMGGRDMGPDEWTEVEILFEAAGAGTRVTVEHRGWEQFAADHPVRHGLTGSAFDDIMSVFWADLLSAHARRIASRSAS